MEKETGEIKWKTQRSRDRELETERQEIGNVLLGAETHTGWEMEILRLRLEMLCCRCC